MQDKNRDIIFMSNFTLDIAKDVVAFMNTAGGTILIGVDKDAKVQGIDPMDSVITHIKLNLVHAITPDPTPFLSIRAIHKDFIHIDVSTGKHRPYYLSNKGMKAGGVYVRHAGSSQPKSNTEICEMVLTNGKHAFESIRSLHQNLTFHELSKAMQKSKIRLDKVQMQSMKLVGEDGLYTNLAYLLSDQCEMATYLALFQGTNQIVLRERKAYSGSILKQIKEIYHFLDLINKTQAFFKGLYRYDRRDYPEEALKEALLYSYIHRDYSVEGNNHINIYDNRIEFVFLGELISNPVLQSFFLKGTQPRNPDLAKILHQLQILESNGTGIEAMCHSPKKPQFEMVKGVFRVTLPNRNEKDDYFSEVGLN